MTGGVALAFTERLTAFCFLLDATYGNSIKGAPLFWVFHHCFFFLLALKVRYFSKSFSLIISWGEIAPRLSKEMQKAIFKGKRETSSGAGEGDVAILAADPVSSVVTLVLPTTSSAISTLYS